MLGHQVPFQHRHLLAILKTDNVVREHRLGDWNRWLGGFDRRGGFAYTGQCLVDLPNETRQILDGDRILCDVSTYDLSREAQHIFWHIFLSCDSVRAI